MRLRKDIWVSSAGLSDMPCKRTGSMCLSIGNCFSRGRWAERVPRSPPGQDASPFDCFAADLGGPSVACLQALSRSGFSLPLVFTMCPGSCQACSVTAALRPSGSSSLIDPFGLSVLTLCWCSAAPYPCLRLYESSLH